jgi:hypothetical protein
MTEIRHTFPLQRPLTLDDGRVVEGMTSLGQSVCVLHKPR